MAEPFRAIRLPMQLEPSADERLHALEGLLVCVVNALAAKGVLSLSEYRERVREMWDGMDAEDASGGCGVVFEAMIERLNAAIPERKGHDDGRAVL